MSIDKFTQDGQDPKVVEKIYNKIIDMLTHGEAINYIAVQKKPAVTLLPDSITISNKRIFLCEFTKLGLATNFEIFSWRDIKDIAFKEEIFGSKVTVIPFTGENLSIDYIPKVQARKLYQLIKDALENGKNTADEQPTPVIVQKTEEKPVVEDSKPISINEMYKQWSQQKKTEEPVEQSISHEAEVPKVETPLPIESVESVEPEEPKSAVVPQQQDYVPSISSHTDTVQPPQSKKEEEDELTLKLKKLKNLYDKQLITQAEYESKKSEILSQI